MTEPRNLVRVDSWQAIVTGVGADAMLIRDRFIKACGQGPGEHFRLAVEKIWHWGLDGKEEREQLVLSLGRSLLFCHMYRYSGELYVGWDAHLNYAKWLETTLARGIDKQTGRLVRLNGVTQGWQQLTEYDVTDVNCLSEWAHAQLVKTLKQYMEERKIDQEIDFKILRGERDGLTTASEEGGIKAKAKRFIRRTGDALSGLRESA